MAAAKVEAEAEAAEAEKKKAAEGQKECDETRSLAFENELREAFGDDDDV